VPGVEIDLTPVGAPRSHHMHTMIRRRRGVGREFIAGVYPELQEGEYTVWGIDGHPLGEVTIVGGRVGEFQAGDCRGHSHSHTDSDSHSHSHSHTDSHSH